MDLYSLIFLNLGIVAFLILLNYGLSKYAIAWFLRSQRTKNVYNNFYDKFILLEIKLPREVFKSPKAMEFVIDAFYQPAGLPGFPSRNDSEGKKKSAQTYLDNLRQYEDDKYKQGQTRLWMTLEIESRGGEIHFYIGTQKRYKEIISSYIYSQFPGIEVTETEDYTDKIRPSLHGGEHDPWAGHAVRTNDKKSYLPIKTYVDYELDKDPKEEFKIDPLIPLLESMANIKADEHVWFQILLRASQNDKKVKADAAARIDEILGIKRYSEDDEKLDKKHKKGTIKEQSREIARLLPNEKQEVEMIQRYTGKLFFDSKIQMLYIAPKAQLRAEADQIVRNALKSFNDQNFNGLRMSNFNTTNAFLDYPDRRRERRVRAGMFYLYATRNPGMPLTTNTPTIFKDGYERLRDYGWRSFQQYLDNDFKEYFSVFNEGEIEMPSWALMNLNQEEIATLYHFPSKAFSAPKFGRVESVKSEPPTNLPV